MQKILSVHLSPSVCAYFERRNYRTGVDLDACVVQEKTKVDRIERDQIQRQISQADAWREEAEEGDWSLGPWVSI